MGARKISAEKILQMEELRAQHYSNLQIASAMKISYGTVNKYLGKQPDGFRADYGSIVAHVTEAEEPKVEQTEKKSPEPSAPVRRNSLRCMSETKVLDGCFYRFTLSTLGSITLSAKTNQENLQLDKPTMESYIVELMDAYEELCKYQTT